MSDELRGSIDYSKLGTVSREGKNFKIFDIMPEDFDRALAELLHNGVERISAISGADNGKSIDVLYHFANSAESITLRITVQKEFAKVNTISGKFPGAKLYERELSEMLGVEVAGNEEPKNLFLSEDSPKAPLRKQ